MTIFIVTQTIKHDGKITRLDGELPENFSHGVDTATENIGQGDRYYVPVISEPMRYAQVDLDAGGNLVTKQDSPGHNLLHKLPDAYLCVVARTGKDQQGDILSLCGDFPRPFKHPKEQAMDFLKECGDFYRTLDIGGPRVIVRNGHLRTENSLSPDDNLDNLPDC